MGQANPEDVLTLSGVYQDAAGHWHAHFAWQEGERSRKGEAVFDSELGRVVLSEHADHWPDSSIREVKRALRQAFADHLEA